MPNTPKKPALADLAVVFRSIEQRAGAVETCASQILSTIKAAKVGTLDEFNELVRAAYTRNGWSNAAGRPAKGSKERPAPDAVQLYVSTVRRAYRMGLPVLSFAKMADLRAAIREHKPASSPPAPVAPELVGVTIKAEHEMTGALWHDLLVLREHLDHERQSKFDDDVRKLLTRYIKAAPDFLKLVA